MQYILVVVRHHRAGPEAGTILRNGVQFGEVPAGILKEVLARVRPFVDQLFVQSGNTLGNFVNRLNRLRHQRRAQGRQYQPSIPFPHDSPFALSLPQSLYVSSRARAQALCVTLKFPRVPARVSEAFVLRTYPLKEADLVVSFLTRDQGKLRGVAKRARRPKSPFGAGLERLSHVRMAYFQRETRELVNLDSCELIRSQFGLVSDYWAGVALDYFAEVTRPVAAAAEPNERFFRLLLAVLDHLRAGGRGARASVARGDVFFSLWAVRLSGWLPELHVCLGCGSLLDDRETPERAFFSRGRAGLMCGHCRRHGGRGAVGS